MPATIYLLILDFDGCPLNLTFCDLVLLLVDIMSDNFKVFQILCSGGQKGCESNFNADIVIFIIFKLFITETK